MLLRPATPLSIFYFAAFALLLLSTLSTPVIKSIPLASYNGYTYGVFGYCKGSSCSGISVGYTADSSDDSEFDLPSGARHTLSTILIVHPIAGFMSLVCFGLAFAAHFHSPSHSPRYLMAVLILTFLTLLLSLLAFLVDILLFLPHMAWGSWLVLAATIDTVLCSIMTCAMRRTLVSRRARKKRIAENAEMNGQNYYESRGLAAVPPAPPVVEDSLPRADSPPPLVSSPVDGKGPEFAAFELQKSSMDDSTPLNPKNPSVRSASTTGDSVSGRGRHYAEQAPPMPSGAAGRGRGPPRDQYGNPLPPNNVYGMQDGQPLHHQGSNGTMGSNRSGGPQPYYGGRGRGGYPLRGRGGYGPRGRGVPPGMRGPPPPGWSGNSRGMGPGPGSMGVAGGSMGRGGRAPPGQYGYYTAPLPQGRGRSPPPRAYDGAGNLDQQGAMALGGVSDQQGPIGQAIEMDGRAGDLSNQGVNNYGLRDSDIDLQGMIGLQQGRSDGAAGGLTVQNTSTSPTSEYSDSSGYVPARQNWVNHQAVPPPTYRDNSDSTLPSQQTRGLSPIAASPVNTEPIELPAGSTHNSPNPSHNRGLSDSSAPSHSYYEDVDPRFAEPIIPQPVAETATPTALPATLTAGAGAQPSRTPSSSPGQVANPATTTLPPVQPIQAPPIHQEAQHPYDYEEIDEGIRSPVESEASHFTSISQRGINPNWRPPPGEWPSNAYGPPRGPRRDDVILNANPDFSLPGVAAPGRSRNVRGGMRGGMRGGRGPAATGIGLGAASGGRFPGPEAL